jgi:hypothetical protein
MARQNHVGGKVALMREAWVCDNWRIPDLLGTYAQEMMSRRRGLWWSSACPVAQHQASQSTCENAAAERVAAVLSSPTFSA